MSWRIEYDEWWRDKVVNNVNSREVFLESAIDKLMEMLDEMQLQKSSNSSLTKCQHDPGAGTIFSGTNTFRCIKCGHYISVGTS